MALVIGDIHGRIDKVEAFLTYKPEEQHIFTGDYVDSFVQSDNIIYQTLKLVIESNAVLLWGNHDIHYLSRAPFRCSGYRQYMAKSIRDIFEVFGHRFIPVITIDGFIITHAGVTQGLADDLNFSMRVTEATFEIHQSIIEDEWAKYQNPDNFPRDGKESPIFNIPKARGGIDKFGGIFWADYRDEQYYKIPQVFGHSKTIDGGILKVEYIPGSDHWALGCDDNKFECFNTKTGEVEVFGEQPRDAA